ncbi:MAG: M6 family metalloprotease domain-containing protein [candidate division Zixibacteria bacterium]
MFKKLLVAPLTVATLILFSAQISAVPPSPEVIQKLKDEGKYEQFLNTMASAHAKGVDAPTVGNDGKLRTPLASLSTVKALVILIDFDDKPYTAGYTAGTPQDFHDLLFSEGVIPTGSMREYYIENSYGEVYMEGDIAGWYRAPEFSDYYVNFCDGSHGFGDYPNNAQRLVEDAIELADPDVDFSQYDNDGDGWVDALFIVHSGTGYENTGNHCEIHSHAWVINQTLRDGVQIWGYSMEPEESPISGGLIPIGVYCHELGHVFGLPDLYDYDYSSPGVGRWCVMAGGSYNGNSRTPSHFSVWCKAQLGWVNPVIVNDNMTDVDIPIAAWNPVSYRLWGGGMIGSEYFLVENRQKQGFDAALPGSGILIWHIDETVTTGNDNEWHKLVALEQADGNFDLENNNNSGDRYDPYPSPAGVTEFGVETIPNSNDYDDQDTQVGVWNISSSDSIMAANFDIMWNRPNLLFLQANFTDGGYGDGDGVMEPGETILLFVEVENIWADAEGVDLTVSVNDPAVIINTPFATLGDIPHGATAGNVGFPISFTIPENYQPRIDTFFFEFTGNSGEYNQITPMQKNVGSNGVLIIDDDNDDDYDEYYIEHLTAELLPHINLDKSTTPITGTDLTKHNTVIWLTGEYQTSPLSLSDISALKYFMENGGSLFLTGQGIAAQLATLDNDFLNNYLRAEYVSTSMIPPVIPNIEGQVLNELDTLNIQGYMGASNQSNPDHLNAVNDGVVEANYVITEQAAAVSYSGDYKLVFFGFGFEAIGEDETRFAKRSDVFLKVLEFLGEINNYVPGDANGDGDANVGDAVYIINYAFKSGPTPIPIEAGDANGDCGTNVGDAVYLISYIFKGGPDPLPGCN